MTFIHVLVGTIVISTGLFTGLLMTVLFFFESALGLQASSVRRSRLSSWSSPKARPN